MESKDLNDQLRTYIQDSLLIGESITLNDSDELLLDGIIDSLGVTRLIGFIRTEYDVVVPAQEATIDNFRSVEVLAGYLRRRLGEE